MGCKHSKDATLDHRGSSIAVPLHPTTPSYHAQDSKLWMTTSGSQSNEFREELPSFVISDSADLVGSSDGEPVQGLVSGFTFSFIHTSEVSSSSGLSLTSSFVSEEQISPGPPESLTFAMTGDPIELQPIPEERRGHDVTPSESGVTEPEGEASPPAAVNQVGESSAVTASTVTESELLVELDASGFSHQSENSSYNTGDTRRSIPVSEHSEAGEYMVTETGDVVRQVEPVPESDVITNDPVERESIDEVAAEIAQNVIDAAVSNVAKSPNRDRSALVAQSSLQVELSSTGIFYLSAKTQPSENAPVQSARPPIYAIVGTSSDKGVVLYHVQLMDDVTDSAKWPAPLRRRYSRFSKMYRKLKETKLPSADKLPKLPRAGVVHYVRGRQSKRTIEERQQQFSNLLRYIAEHRELCDNAAFQSFLTQ